MGKVLASDRSTSPCRGAGSRHAAPLAADPWHRASDQDDDVEQPGLDLVYSLGLTRGLPMLTPVALLYGTPEDAAAEISQMNSR